MSWLLRSSLVGLVALFGATAASAQAAQLNDEQRLDRAIAALKPPMYPAKAKRVIFLYMSGGAVQGDTKEVLFRLRAGDARQCPCLGVAEFPTRHGRGDPR